MTSLSREKVEEICQYIRKSPNSVFGQKYWQCRHVSVIQSQQKADKWQTRNCKISGFSSLMEKLFEIWNYFNKSKFGWEDRPGGTKTLSSTPIVVLILFLRKPDGSKTKDLALITFNFKTLFENTKRVY
ncbi:hypothetical protein Mgra_00005631 [Meloidogyne graminicola]|uniref:Uncharacterized protein n=1 Tax=Meloidogyne graminicola TaxID=189291 RepID=A0A8S9ZP93_9BILA|nr:hypothetical protein Mgra_00005631 [Meloidogyne graminicola]